MFKGEIPTAFLLKSRICQKCYKQKREIRPIRVEKIQNYHYLQIIYLYAWMTQEDRSSEKDYENKNLAR